MPQDTGALGHPGPVRDLASLKVVGVGGGGCNAIHRMMESDQVPGVAYVAVNSDIQSLESVGNCDVVQIGEGITHGFGAGGDPRVGARAAEESRHRLKKAMSGAEIIFISVGMGGGTGTGAAPLVARLARETSALTVAVVTTPFSFEGRQRLEQAMAGISKLRREVDNLIIVHNDRIVQLLSEDTPMEEALRTADDVLTQGIISISKLVNVPGEINVDLADIKVVLRIPGSALLAMGEGQGPRAVADAAEQAMANPLLDLNMQGATGVLFNIEGGPDLKLRQVNEAGEFIASRADRNARIFFGFMKPREELVGQARIILLATGMKQPAKKIIS